MVRVKGVINKYFEGFDWPIRRKNFTNWSKYVSRHCSVKL